MVDGVLFVVCTGRDRQTDDEVGEKKEKFSKREFFHCNVLIPKPFQDASLAI